MEEPAHTHTTATFLPLHAGNINQPPCMVWDHELPAMRTTAILRYPSSPNNTVAGLRPFRWTLKGLQRVSLQACYTCSVRTLSSLHPLSLIRLQHTELHSYCPSSLQTFTSLHPVWFGILNCLQCAALQSPSSHETFASLRPFRWTLKCLRTHNCTLLAPLRWKH